MKLTPPGTCYCCCRQMIYQQFMSVQMCEHGPLHTSDLRHCLSSGVPLSHSILNGTLHAAKMCVSSCVRNVKQILHTALCQANGSRLLACEVAACSALELLHRARKRWLRLAFRPVRRFAKMGQCFSCVPQGDVYMVER